MWLGGTHPLENQNKFNGLLAPEWPLAFPEIDTALARQGEQLYSRMCQGCHLPSVKSAQFWGEKYWQPIEYIQDNVRKQTSKPYLALNVIPLSKIGTDSAQAGILGGRTVDTTGLNLDTQVCASVSNDLIYTLDETPDQQGYAGGESDQVLAYVPLVDSATSMFGLALGAIVERTNQHWFKQNYIPLSQQLTYEGFRPNCLRPDKGYKARPLNGVWATAPFLHNGSIANIYDLLSVQSDRPRFVQLGSQEFDPSHLGIVQDETVKSLNNKKSELEYKLTTDYVDGLFILDADEPGNHNTGHLFDDDANQVGRIGRSLTEEEKLAIIEYLKII